MEVLELFLGCSLALVVVCHGLWKWLDGCVSDGDQHLLLLLGLLLLFDDFLFFWLNLSLQRPKIGLIFNRHFVLHSISRLFFIPRSIVRRIKVGSSYICFCWNSAGYIVTALFAHYFLIKNAKIFKNYKRSLREK